MSPTCREVSPLVTAAEKDFKISFEPVADGKGQQKDKCHNSEKERKSPDPVCEKVV